MFGSDPEKQKVVDETALVKLTRLDIANIRIIIFDSSSMERELKGKQKSSEIFTKGFKFDTQQDDQPDQTNEGQENEFESCPK